MEKVIDKRMYERPEMNIVQIGMNHIMAGEESSPEAGIRSKNNWSIEDEEEEDYDY